MAKKSFKNKLGGREYLNVINTNKDEKQEAPEVKNETKKEVSKTTKKVSKKSSNYQPHTLKIRKDIWEASQALAWWERAKFQDFFTKVLENHIDAIDPRELADIVEKYKKYKKK